MKNKIFEHIGGNRFEVSKLSEEDGRLSKIPVDDTQFPDGKAFDMTWLKTLNITRDNEGNYVVFLNGEKKYWIAEKNVSDAIGACIYKWMSYKNRTDMSI